MTSQIQNEHEFPTDHDVVLGGHVITNVKEKKGIMKRREG
jgi:hypothetical protein